MSHPGMQHGQPSCSCHLRMPCCMLRYAASHLPSIHLPACSLGSLTRAEQSLKLRLASLGASAGADENSPTGVQGSGGSTTSEAAATTAGGQPSAAGGTATTAATQQQPAKTSAAVHGLLAGGYIAYKCSKSALNMGGCIKFKFLRVDA